MQAGAFGHGAVRQDQRNGVAVFTFANLDFDVNRLTRRECHGDLLRIDRGVGRHRERQGRDELRRQRRGDEGEDHLAVAHIHLDRTGRGDVRMRHHIGHERIQSFLSRVDRVDVLVV